MEGSVGFVFDTDHPMESGFFFQFGPGAGLNIGGAVCGGFTTGDIEGWGSDVDANVHPWAPTLFFDDSGPIGASFGWGPGGGVSVGATHGWTLSFSTVTHWFGGS